MNELRERIRRGLNGYYRGLSNGHGRINDILFNTQRATYYLYGGLSGAAKTTLVDYEVQAAIKDADENNIECEVFYYSFEIPKLKKKIMWTSNHIYKKHGVAIDPATMGGLGERRMTLREQQLVDAEIDEVEEKMNRIKFRFDPLNPTGIFKELMDYAEATGTFHYEPYVDETGATKQRIIGYTPNNPDRYVIVVIDHIALAKKERGYNTKENIDKLSEYFMWFRNICGFTIKVVQQFNQGLSSVDRQKFKGVDLSPQQSDFKDSTNPYADADVVIGVMNPWKMDFKEYMFYNLTKFESKFRLYKVMKNREEEDNVCYGLFFKPEAGTFRELPPPDDFRMNIASYDDYR